ncbi:MAG TPA: DMT family transporter [Rectinemataceae bacterium]|nr:DMT family transporter [Rectinemataceae bacterium]
MPFVDVLLLVTLSGIWGSSFMFMRHLAPLLGAAVTADMRILIAGLALTAFFAATKFSLGWKRNWKHFLVIGLVNSGVPFLLYSFAALYLPASVEVIFNSMSPLFGAVFSAIWLGEPLSLRRVAALVLGLAGVLTVSSLGAVPPSPWAIPSVLACLAATICYALAGVYIKKRASDLKPRATAAGSQLVAGAALLPLAVAARPASASAPGTLIVLVVFALLCSALAYLIYYRLIADVGPTKALTVTFLMPVFGMFWGWLFLGERIGLSMIGGTLLILAGTFLVAASGSPARRPPASGRASQPSSSTR